MAVEQPGPLRAAERPRLKLIARPPAVLVAGADWRTRRLVRAAIRSERYELVEAVGVDDAWTAIREHRPRVIVLDERLNGGQGLELARAIKLEPRLASTRIVLLGDAVEAGRIADALGVGVDAYVARPFSPRELLETVDTFVRTGPAGPPPSALEGTDAEEARRARANVRLAYAFRVAEQAAANGAAPAPDPAHLASAIDDAQQLRMVEDFRDAYQASLALASQLQSAYEQTITALAKAVEARDPYTGGHVERVRGYAVDIGRRLGLAGDALRQLEIGAVLHDVGKIGVPDAVLTKPGPLEPAEWAVMRRHPEIGRGLLAGITFLERSLDAVAHHHERWDGGGYPGGLSRQSIPVCGRIVAVADAFDAMTSSRPYRMGLPFATARDEIKRGRGTGFDPEVVDAFLDVQRGRAA